MDGKLEMERIIKKILRYKHAVNISENEALHYITIEAGYKTCNYIPNKYRTDDLIEISLLLLRYVRKYGMTLGEFILKYSERREYCKIHGFMNNDEQTTLNMGDLRAEISFK